MSTEDFKNVFDGVFKGRLMDLCRHQITNFVVQSILENKKSEPLMTSILDEMLPHIKTLLGMSIVIVPFSLIL